MIARAGGRANRAPRATALLLLAFVSAACGASQVSSPPATTAGSTAATPASPTPVASPSIVLASPGIPATNMVDIGGRSLYASCIGESAPGEPTVVFEHGLGEGAASWTSVQATVAGTVRACVYARAGTGPSDPAGTTPRTTQDLADDLTTLLDRAGIHPPYVFVSHSLGPWVTTLYTIAHPEAVVGLVFVDPRGPDVSDGWAAALPSPTVGESEALTRMRDWVTFVADPSTNPEGLDITASEAEVRAALGTGSPPFGDIPLIVLQAGSASSEWADLPEPARAAWGAAWFDGQTALASTSSGGRLDVVADSRHFVQSDAPSAVIDAILEVLAGG